MKAPEPKQIEEWLEAEVTLYFRSLIKQQLEAAFERRAEVFFPGEPMKTQEGKATLIGIESVWQDLLEAFDEKDLSQLEIASEERVGNSPLRGSDSDPPG